VLRKIPSRDVPNRAKFDRILDPQGGKIVDIEEAAPVDGVVGAAPPCETKMLALQQAMEPSAAGGRARIESAQTVPLDSVGVSGRDRKNVVEITRLVALAVGIEGERDFRIPHDLAVRSPEDGNQNLAV